MGKVNGGSIRHAVSKAGSAGQTVGTLSGGADVTDVKVALEADMKLAATYMSWQDANGNAVVATEGGKGTPWRIYDGHTTPLLTGLMKGTKRLAKVYDGNVFATTDPHITLVNTGKDVGTYDAYSDQLGYDLIGGATITQRTLTMSGVAAQSKTYDGTTAADAAQFHATLNNVVAGEESLVSATATGAAYNSKDVASANAVSYTFALRGTGAGNYRLSTDTLTGTGTITHSTLTLTADARSIVQGEAMPSFTGCADGFAVGENPSVLGADGIEFGTTVTSSDTPGSYDITGRIGGMSDGVAGNYRIRQATGNATAFTIHAAAVPGGILTALVQDAAPRFDMGFEGRVYLYGMPRPIPVEILGFYRFAPARDLLIEGLRLD